MCSGKKKQYMILLGFNIVCSTQFWALISTSTSLPHPLDGLPQPGNLTCAWHSNNIVCEAGGSIKSLMCWER